MVPATKSYRRVGDADRAAHEPSHSSVSRPSGEHPSRWSALRKDGWLSFFGNDEPVCPHCAAECSVHDNDWWHLYSDDETHTVECPSCDREFAVTSSASWTFSTDEQDAMVDEDHEQAIAMEAREGADPKGLDGEAATARAEGIAHV